MKHSIGLTGRNRFNYYVDSVGGNNANSGTSPLSPKQTLSSITFTNGLKVGLKYGSTFREKCDLSAKTGISLIAYGTPSDGQPIIDGTSIVSVWTAQGSTDVWQATITHDASGTDRLTAYDNFALLTRVADIATCSSTPGSFVDAKGSDGSPLTIYIHTSDSSNPNSNGRTYEVTTRNIGLFLGTSCISCGIRTQRVIGNNGSYQSLVFSNVFTNRIVSVYGTKHNLSAGDGGSLNDIILLRNDAPTAYEVSNDLLVHFVVDAAGKSLVAHRIFIGADGYSGGNGLVASYTAHDSSSHNFTGFTGTSLGCSGIVSGWGFIANTVNLSGFVSLNQASPIAIRSNNASCNYLQISSRASTTGFSLNPITSPATITINDSVSYDIGSNDGLIRLSTGLNGCTINLNRCVFYHSAARPTVRNESMSSGTISINNTVIVYPTATFFNQISIPTGVTYTGDYNVFLAPTSSSLNLNYQGTTCNTLAAWQSATGQDAHSIVLQASDLANLFSGTVSNGDFRLSTNSTGSQVTALPAGPTSYWNWYTSSALSGSPSAWPNAPFTLTQSSAYMLNPSNWIF